MIPTSKTRRWFLASLLLSGSLLAQQQQPERADEEDPEKDTVVMSPFVIVSGSETGYTATNTLAGTRLNTSLKDIGSAISVVTAEFLADIGSTGADTLLTYTLGTEVGGVHGNFAGTDTANARPNSEGARTEPGGNQRIRGLAPGETARDYYITDIPFDSYNTSAVTINRGPNSLLFGIGSPGGVINHTTIAPTLRENFREVSVRYGSNGSHRESLDVNQTILKNRLGLRIAAVNDQTNFKQEPAYEDDRRLFGSLKAVLHKGKRGEVLGDTILRANAETGQTRGLPPNIIPPSDGFSHWFALPTVDYEAYTGIQMPDWYTKPGIWQPKYTLDNRTDRGASYSLGTYTNPMFLQNGVYMEAGPGVINFNTPQGTVQGGMGRLRYQTGRSGRPLMDQWISIPMEADDNYITGFAAKSVTREQFDYYNKLISGDNGWRNRDWDAYNITLEQGFWDYRAGIEMALDKQSYTNDTALPIGFGFTSGTAATDVNVDIGEYLYDDVPNPNVGRPMMRDWGLPNHIVTEDRSVRRVQAFFKLNGTDLFDSERAAFWFGNHTFTGVYMDQSYDRLRRSYNLAWDSDTVNVGGVLNPQVNSFNRTVVPLVYVGPDMRGFSGADQVRLEQITARMPTGGERYQMWYYDQSSPAASRVVRQGEFYVRKYLQSGDVSSSEIESRVFSWQSDLLGGHLKGLLGWRTDRQLSYEQADFATTRLADGEYDATKLKLGDLPADDQSGNTFTWSVVGVYPEKLLGDLPLDSEVRLFANGSENFNPVGSRRNIRNELLDAPTGKTDEWGFMLDLFDGKVSVRTSFYETAVTNQTLNGLGGVAVAAMRWPMDWLQRARQSEVNELPLDVYAPELVARGIDTYAKLYQAILALPPTYMSQIAQYRMTPVDGGYDIDYTPIQNLVATTDSVSTGWEAEIVANPTPSIRMLFNVAKQEAVRSNIAPALSEVAADFKERILASPLYGIDDTLADGSPSTYDSRYLSTVNVPLAGLQAQEGTLSQELREWRANFVGSYRFRDGVMKGLTLGGALRWQSEVATGYELRPNADGLPVPILSNAFYDDADLRGDAFVTYQRKIFNNKVDWKIQLNVRNLIGSNDPIVVTTNPNGEVAVVRAPPPTEWFITNTFRF